MAVDKHIKQINAINTIVKFKMPTKYDKYFSHDIACFPCNKPIYYFFFAHTCTIRNVNDVTSLSNHNVA